MSDHFVTEFGHRIDFVPGFYERNKEYVSWIATTDVSQSVKTYGPSGKVDPRLLFRDWIAFSAAAHFLGRHGLFERQYGTAIDLGGAEGTMMRLFRAYGTVADATSVDLIDFSGAVDDAYFAEFIAHLNDVPALPLEIRKFINHAKSQSYFNQDEPLLTDFRYPGSLRQHLVMNMMDVPGSYDLVTAFAALDHVGLDELLNKVRSMLTPGGIFFAQIQLWWWVVNTTGILGHFPYVGQRLSRTDLDRYFSENHPEHLDFVRRRYPYFHHGEHPTAREWVRRAGQHGLELVAMERLMPDHHKFGVLTPPELEREPWFSFEDVLRDVHHLHSDVTQDDLKTQSIFVAFRAD